MRFERMIFGLGNHCSILLSYEATLAFRFFSKFYIILVELFEQYLLLPQLFF